MDTFGPVVRQNSLRLIYALAIENDLILRQLDVSTAFLNGDIEEEIFMKQPEKCIKKGFENKVCKLNKAIYGLKQAGRQWFKKLNTALKDFGMNQLKNNQCIYYMRKNNVIMLLAVYVDNIVITHKDTSFIML